jgi:hypothetical protein
VEFHIPRTPGFSPQGSHEGFVQELRDVLLLWFEACEVWARIVQDRNCVLNTRLNTTSRLQGKMRGMSNKAADISPIWHSK